MKGPIQQCIFICIELAKRQKIKTSRVLEEIEVLEEKIKKSSKLIKFFLFLSLFSSF